jgi:segregation and condensation protein A
MPYAVVTSVFEGPFDLLLHLILKQEVELWEISLVEIVDAYITELDRMDELSPDEFARQIQKAYEMLKPGS